MPNVTRTSRSATSTSLTWPTSPLGQKRHSALGRLASGLCDYRTVPSNLRTNGPAPSR